MIRGGVIAAILVVLLGAAAATPWVVTVPSFTFGDRERPVPTATPMTIPPQEPPTRDLPVAETLEKFMLTLIVLVMVALVALAVYWIVRRLRAAWRPEDGASGADRLDGDAMPGEAMGIDPAALATAVARAEAHLAAAAEPGDAVVAAWVALEDEARLQGVGRRPAQTATEFTVELLTHSAAPAASVSVLRGLYHRARFTAHPVTSDDVADARAALARIAAALDAATEARPRAGEPW